MAQTYRDFGIILKKHTLGEADAIVVLFTRGEGLVRAVAKGVRRMTSRKGGNLELFNQVDVLFSRGRSMDVLSEAIAIDTFRQWRDDLSLVSQSFYVADLTAMMLVEGESYPLIYDRLVEVFAWLGHTSDPSLLVRWYEVQLLELLGFWASGRMVSESANAISLLESFVTMPVATVSQLSVSERLRFELERLMREHLAEVLERDVTAQAFIYQVRALEKSLEY